MANERMTVEMIEPLWLFRAHAGTRLGDVNAATEQDVRQWHSQAQSRNALTDGRTPGRDAWPALRETHDQILDEAHALEPMLSSFQWLRHLRALPGEYAVKQEYLYSGNYTQKRLYPEVLSGEARGGGDVVAPPDRYVTEQAQVDAVLHYAMLCREAEEAATLMRIAAMECPILLSAGNCPMPYETGDEWRAIALLDERRNRDGNEYGIFGSVLDLPPSEVDHVSYSHTYRIYRPPLDGTEVSLRMSQTQSTLNRVVPDFEITTDAWRAPSLFHGYQWYREDLPLLLLGLRSTLGLLNHDLMDSLLQQGYFLATRSALHNALASTVLDAASQDWSDVFPLVQLHEVGPVEILRAMRRQGSVLPLLPGPVVRNVNQELVCIDLYMLGEASGYAFVPRFPGGGQGANVRNDFEIVTQNMIDASAWRPSPEIGRLRGRDLVMHDGTALTDVDSVAMSGDTLLLVNCKSYRPARLYEGDWSAIKTVREQLVADRDDWKSKIDGLRNAPHGRNYDVQAWPRLIPLLCIPGAQHLFLPEAQEEALPGLPSICTYAELQRFVEASPGSAA